VTAPTAKTRLLSVLLVERHGRAIIAVRDMGRTDPDITVLLQRAAAGESDAESDLFDAIYNDLRAIARATLSSERPGHTLQPTVLVHEVFLRLRGSAIDFQSRHHFFAIAARAMRRILVDHARARVARKRPGSAQQVELDERMILAEDDPETILAVDAALDHLRDLDTRQARIVEMRFFGGLTEEEIGTVLKISSRTVKREWQFARLWLFDRLTRKSDDAESGGRR
jgi:RNA polymerase sigma-70 factor (ECF subfamily)